MKTETTITAEVLDTEQAAIISGYSPKTLRNKRLEDRQRMSQGGVRKGPPWVMRGGRPVYLRQELIEWIYGKSWADDEEGLQESHAPTERAGSAA